MPTGLAYINYECLMYKSGPTPPPPTASTAAMGYLGGEQAGNATEWANFGQQNTPTPATKTSS